MDNIDRSLPASLPPQRTPGETPVGKSAAATGASVVEGIQPSADQSVRVQTLSVVLHWLLHDIPYIAMLFLALIGVVLRLPVAYWIILTPIFAIISITEGWRNFITKSERIGFVVRVALDWCALLLAIYLLHTSGVQGVMNANATSLGMMILLALGTFVSGIQARVWQICSIGGVLFLAVPGLGWLDQSPLLLTVATCVIVVLSGVAWWITRRSQTTIS
jgi:hypothetical protein